MRRDSLGDIKELLKEKMIGEDEERKGQEEIQELTNQHVEEIDQIIAVKEKELMVV